MSPTTTATATDRPLSVALRRTHRRLSSTHGCGHNRGRRLNQPPSYPHTETVVHRPVDNAALGDSRSS
jgi:hypothetical protein